MTADAVGGVWQYAIELATSLRPLGWQTRLALLGPAPTDVQRREAEEAGATLIETGLTLDWLAGDADEVLATGQAITALAESEGVDLLQLNQPAFAAAPRGRVPRIAVSHSCVDTWWRAVETGPAPDSFAWQTDLVRRGLTTADAVVAPSASHARAVAAAYGIAEPVVVHNGRTPLGGSGGGPHDFAFTCGRLWDRAKNVATLDRAAALLGVPFKAAGATVGPNGERIELRHLLGLGSVDEAVIAGCIGARPVFASAARYEPFGLAVLEAAMAGCALVLSDIPTHRELWDGAARFVDPLDADGFAQALEGLLGDVPARLVQGDLARRRAQKFTPGKMAEGMAALYARLLGPHSRAAA
ncbi:glycosyltransferase family 4 protein [Sphingomonas jatrophae]|nr:glycosyltransferase family 4 protein [Sphingomonas jatrophae]